MKIKLLTAMAFSMICLNCISALEMTKQRTITLNQESQQWAQKQLATMSCDEKIGQLFMLAIWSEWSDAKINQIYAEAEQYHIGGACFFAGKAARQIEITNHLNAKANLPLLIGIDGEWGVGMRITDAQDFPFAMNLGAVKDSNLIYQMGEQIGRDCKRMGIHINFAPVHDLNSNPLNPVINYRSYGSNPETVSIKTRNYIAGMQSQGVMAVAKHFPGHGDTHTDSHHALPIINRSKEQFEKREFIPFKASINNGLQALMIGHLHVPSLDKSGMPASLSKDIIQGVVKQELGFKGLIITDALNMDAVAKGYENHYLKAFTAGNDILLFPADLGIGVQQIKEGLSQGIITEEELNERCLRVLAYKHAIGAHQYTPIDASNIVTDLNTPTAKALNHKLYAQSITLVKNENNSLPIKSNTNKKIAILSINGTNPQLGTECQKYGKITAYNESVKTANDVTLVATKLETYDEVIVALHGTQKKLKTDYGINQFAIALMNELAKNKVVHAIVLANPYSIRGINKSDFDRLSSLIFTYGNEYQIQSITAEILFGKQPCVGIFPLNVNEFIKEGMNIKL